MNLATSALVASTLLWGAAALTQSRGAVDHDQQRKAVDIIRIVNTAESQYFQSVGRYGSIEDMLKSGAIAQAHSMFPDGPDIASSGESLSGFSARLIISADGKRYEVSVTQEGKPQAGLVGFFSDERGLIYQGHPI